MIYTTDGCNVRSPEITGLQRYIDTIITIRRIYERTHAMMKDYTHYTNEELVTIIRSGDPDSDAVGDAYAQLFQNLRPVTLHESKM